jgi:acylphosphatase
MIRLTAYVSGRVQRTGYRAKVVSLAKEMGLVGFVQNRPEGQVLVIAEGENKDDLERLASAIKIKNALIDVQSISAEYSHGSGEYSIFRKITGPEEVGERLDDGIEILKELVVGINKLAIGVNNLDTSLNNLTIITKDGFENQSGKMDQMLDKQDETIEEIQGLREDTMRRSDAKLSRIEKDIRVIKSKIGIR